MHCCVFAAQSCIFSESLQKDPLFKPVAADMSDFCEGNEHIFPNSWSLIVDLLLFDNKEDIAHAFVCDHRFPFVWVLDAALDRGQRRVGKFLISTIINAPREIAARMKQEKGNLLAHFFAAARPIGYPLSKEAVDDALFFWNELIRYDYSVKHALEIEGICLGFLNSPLSKPDDDTTLQVLKMMRKCHNLPVHHRDRGMSDNWYLLLKMIVEHGFKKSLNFIIGHWPRLQQRIDISKAPAKKLALLDLDQSEGITVRLSLNADIFAALMNSENKSSNYLHYAKKLPEAMGVCFNATNSHERTLGAYASLLLQDDDVSESIKRLCHRVDQASKSNSSDDTSSMSGS